MAAEIWLDIIVLSEVRKINPHSLLCAYYNFETSIIYIIYYMGLGMCRPGNLWGTMGGEVLSKGEGSEG